uniref:Orf207 n=1 Tax=Rhodomonas salina TaxID=3034 RepID=Q9G8W1_RHDSA|nr:orf207 [Rhodomonas salina]AAG17736.1 orf207 [Rhodomonas salina]
MSNLFVKKKLYTKNINHIKKNLCCYEIPQNYLLKTNVTSIHKWLVVELSLTSSLKIIQYETNFSNEKKLLNLLSIQKNKKSFFLNDSLKRKLERFFFVLYFFKQAFLLKNFIMGQIYRPFKNGFIVVISGLVCFLPKNNCSYINFDMTKNNIFFISSFNENNVKTVILSQRNMYKRINYTLFNMASRFVRFKKSYGRRNSGGQSFKL